MTFAAMDGLAQYFAEKAEIAIRANDRFYTLEYSISAMRWAVLAKQVRPQ